MLRFGAMFNDETSFEVVLREARDTLAGANPKHCCWVKISRAMDSSRDLIIFSVYTYRGETYLRYQLVRGLGRE